MSRRPTPQTPPIDGPQAADPTFSANLVLGWTVTDGLDPSYWILTDARPGRHESKHTVQVAPQSIAHHTVIVAQSGSGKSFFLGRLIEEIILKTKSRVLIFDPNADFRSIDKPAPETLWTQDVMYDFGKRRGFLPDEATQEQFARRWAAVDKKIETLASADAKRHRDLKLWWPDIAIEFLSGQLDPALKSELTHCHAIVRDILELHLRTKRFDQSRETDLLDQARRFLAETRQHSETDVLYKLQGEYKLPDENNIESDASVTSRSVGEILTGPLSRFNLIEFLIPDRDRVEATKRRLQQLYERISKSRGFVSATAEQIYFSSAHTVRSSGMLGGDVSPDGMSADMERQAEGKERKKPKIEPSKPVERLRVIDLPSIRDPELRLLAVSTILQGEWNRARQDWSVALEGADIDDERVPTFVIVDEAHNLFPAGQVDGATARVREQFRTVAAEGRKFGLFLILVSQRPDKIDPLVISECENRALMKIGSQLVLDSAAELLGLADVSKRILQKCLEFGVGRVLLVGPWAPAPTLMFAAARRTAEGGKNLRPEYWAEPTLEVSAAARQENQKPRGVRVLDQKTKSSRTASSRPASSAKRSE